MVKSKIIGDCQDTRLVFRHGSLPFRKRSMPFSRHLKSCLAVSEFFSTKLKKKENWYGLAVGCRNVAISIPSDCIIKQTIIHFLINLYITTKHGIRNLSFLASLLYRYANRLILQISAKLIAIRRAYKKHARLVFIPSLALKQR